MPAKMPLAGVNFPFSSINALRMESKDRNRTPALKVVPYEVISEGGQRKSSEVYGRAIRTIIKVEHLV